MRWLIAIAFLLVWPVAAQATDLDLFIQIIECESSGRHDAENKHEVRGGSSLGIAQFQQETFYRFAKLAGLKNPQWKKKILHNPASAQ